jgi:hypothetical protein
VSSRRSYLFRRARTPIFLDEAIRTVCEGVLGSAPAQFRSLLSPEDLQDIAAGDIPVETLHAYAPGRIGAPVHVREDAKPRRAVSGSIVITDADLEAARKGGRTGSKAERSR